MKPLLSVFGERSMDSPLDGLPVLFPSGTTSREITVTRDQPSAVASRSMSMQQYLSTFGDIATGPGILSRTEAWKNPHVRRCVEATAQAIAHLPFAIYSNDEPQKKHWWLDFVQHSNEFLQLSEHELKEQTVAMRELFGESFWFLDRSDSPTRSGKKAPIARLWIYHPHAVTEAIDVRTGEQLGWFFQYETKRFFVDRTDVVHFRRYDPMRHNPIRPSRGTSPLDAAMLAVSTDVSASKFNLDFFSRGFAPGVILLTKEDIEAEPNADQKLSEKLRAQHAGKNNGVAILNGAEVSVLQVSTNQKDSEFIAGKKMAMNEILEVFGVPPCVAGNQDQKYDNAEMQLLLWWDGPLASIRSNLRSAINNGPLKAEQGFTCDLETKGVEVLQKRKRDRFTAAAPLQKQGVPWDVLNETFDLGLRTFPGSDVAWVAFGQLPVEDVLNPVEDPEPEAVTTPPTQPPAEDPEPDELPAPKDDEPRIVRVDLTPARFVRLGSVENRAEGPFDFASTQINFTGDVAEMILGLAKTIPDEDLAEKGRESDPHVTVKFGIDPDVTAGEMLEVMEHSDSADEMAQRGGTLTLGATAIFETEPGSHGDGADVVYIAVESPDLVLLNKIISDAVAVTDTHPVYVPHVTLAYVKKGEGAKYAGNMTLEGVTVDFTAINFSDAEGNLTRIPLAGEGRRSSRVMRGLKSRANQNDEALRLILEIITADDDKLRKLARRFTAQAVEAGARQVAKLLGIEALVAIDNPRIVEFLEQRGNLIVSVNKTTADRINRTVRDLMGNGSTPEDIGEEIRETYRLREKQARLIARQEVGSGLNGGRFLQMEEEGAPQHEWLSSRDDRVRDTHKAIDGETVRLGELFSLGLRYPQDPEGEPEEVINCRCITLPATSERSRMNDETRAAYWRASVKNVRGIETQATSALQRFLFTQRSAVLKALADVGVAK